MSKGLEELHHPRIELASIDISAEGKHDIAYMPFYKTKQYAVIEKELKRLEEYDKTEYSALIERYKKLYKEKKVDAKKLKALEIIKKLLNLKVIELLPNDSDTRLFVNCGNFKASVLIPPAYIDLLKEVLL